MCPPVLAVAAAGLAAAGTITAGVSQAQNMRYQAKVADANARLENQQSLDAIQRGQIDRLQLDRKYSNLQGQQAAATAANGIDLGFGSAAQVAGETSMLRNEDASSLYKNQADEIRGHDISASNYKGEAQAKRQAATGALISAGFGAASSALGGATQFSKLRGLKAYGISGSDGIY